jgi:hypothetical protein
MSRAKRVKTCVTAAVILAAVLPLFYCAANESDVDHLVLAPAHRSYGVGETFGLNDDHLKVYVVYRSGVSEKVSWTNPELEVAVDGNLTFTTPGPRTIFVRYRGAADYFTISVGGNTSDDGKTPPVVPESPGTDGGDDGKTPPVVPETPGTDGDTTITITINW